MGGFVALLILFYGQSLIFQMLSLRYDFFNYILIIFSNYFIFQGLVKYYFNFSKSDFCDIILHYQQQWIHPK